MLIFSGTHATLGVRALTNYKTHLTYPIPSYYYLPGTTYLPREYHLTNIIVSQSAQCTTRYAAEHTTRYYLSTIATLYISILVTLDQDYLVILDLVSNLGSYSYAFLVKNWKLRMFGLLYDEE